MKRLVVCATAVFALTTALAASGPASMRVVAPPTDLRAFELRADERVKADHTYAQMPAFAWKPVRDAKRYELQIATSRSFTESSIVLSQRFLRTPVASVQVQVPWMTGDPYALWAQVRAVVDGGITRWSKPFGFNTTWQQVPKALPAPSGLVRWTPVVGATGYEVWFPDAGSRFTTFTNVADQRETWTFHQSRAQTIRWRVRAIRSTTLDELPNGVTIAKYGPYSPVFTSTNPASIATAPLSGVSALSNVSSVGTKARSHQLTPGFAWSGTDGVTPGGAPELWRAYVFSDRSCVNPVMVGPAVGGPAWAPRAPGLAMPDTVKKLGEAQGGKPLDKGVGGDAYMADGTPVVGSEDAKVATAPAKPAASGSTSSGSATPAAATEQPAAKAVVPGKIQLPDSGWPDGRYWWTVVPIAIKIIISDPVKGPQDSDVVAYHDGEMPEDACAAGRVWPFGVKSAPVTRVASRPLASGVSAARVTSAVHSTPKFYELPLVTWMPALGAQRYEIELSRKLYPWVPLRRQTSLVTSAVLNLKTTNLGRWYYRVRGINPSLPSNAQKMTWSSVSSITIVGHRFVVVR